MNRQHIALILLVILYSVGLYAFITDWSAVILLTPANLIISFMAIILTNYNVDTRMVAFIGLGWLLGYGIEVVGVQTGWPFGSYYYQDVLGLKVFDTPLLIGVNWLILLLSTRAVTDALIGHYLIIFKAGLAALLMVGLDLLIEPVAIAYDFWQWENASIPLSNYISWYVIAFILHILQYRLVRNYKNHTAIGLFIIQIVFFGLINIVK